MNKKILFKNVIRNITISIILYITIFLIKQYYNNVIINDYIIIIMLLSMIILL